MNGAVMTIVVMGIALEVQYGVHEFLALGHQYTCARVGQRLPAHAEHQEEGGKPTAHGMRV